MRPLDTIKEVALPQGTVRYRDTGRGEPIVFVHGFMVDGRLWRKVVPMLEGDHRCIAPDWPLGSHEVPMNADADVSPPGVAAIIADFIEALGLENVTLVGNDSGGAISQIVAAEHPKRIGRLVLTNCDAYDNFPPKGFRWLVKAAHIPGFVFEMAQPMRSKAFRNGPLAFGHVAKHGLDQEILKDWVRPGIESRGVRRDIGKLLRGQVGPHALGDPEAEALRSPGADRLVAGRQAVPVPLRRASRRRPAERASGRDPRLVGVRSRGSAGEAGRGDHGVHAGDRRSVGVAAAGAKRSPRRRGELSKDR